MPDLYVTAAQLKLAAVANESDDATIFDLLAESVSRLFDRECEVSDGFFKAAPGATHRIFTADGGRYLNIGPYVPDTISAIDIAGNSYFEALLSNRLYKERDGYLVFDFEINDGIPVGVTAIFGFPALPADIQQACLEQGLMMWRRKDLTFAEISGVPTAAVVAEFSPTFSAVTKRYRGLYSANGYFV